MSVNCKACYDLKAPAEGLGKTMLLQGLHPEGFPRGRNMGGSYRSDGKA